MHEHVNLERLSKPLDYTMKSSDKELTESVWSVEANR